MEQNTEQDWVQRAKRGEPAAIAELFRLYWRAARAAAFGVTGDFALAEDAAAEAFYAAIESLPDLRDAQRFGPWLRTIVIRTARRQKAKTSKENGAGLQSRPDVKSPPPGADLERRELAALIHEAVGHLSETLREAVVLFYFEGYSLKEAAGFLDIPEGTLKRRLHDGRERLRDAAEQILKGAKPMNVKREQILRQLKDASKEGLDSEAFFQAMRQALSLRPAPNDLMRKVMQKHWAKKLKKLPLEPEKERNLRGGLGRIYSASERARDPNHPVGAATNAIRAALPEFKQWQLDFSEVDISGIVRHMFEGKANTFLSMMPPGFDTDAAGSYIHSISAWLIEDEDGSLRTSFEIMQNKDTKDSMLSQMKRGGRLSDALSLLLKRAEPLELRAIEELLRRLSNEIVPETPVFFCSYEEPRYRAGLRMQLGDNPVPAAIGGVQNPWPGLPEGINIASVIIYLEPWAAAQSGKAVNLADFSPLDFMNKEGK
ncbi:MAG: RNA polymerase sigma factor [Planctomycetota bacterium]|jgi:RNA polymerase sigma factor (sigma-70 family)